MEGSRLMIHAYQMFYQTGIGDGIKKALLPTPFRSQIQMDSTSWMRPFGKKCISPLRSHLVKRHDFKNKVEQFTLRQQMQYFLGWKKNGRLLTPSLENQVAFNSGIKMLFI